MTTDHPVRTYGGWRRSRTIGLLGLGPAATFTLLGCFAALIVLAAFSIRLLLYVAPPADPGRRYRSDPGRRRPAGPAHRAAAALVARHPRGPHRLPRRSRAAAHRHPATARHARGDRTAVGRRRPGRPLRPGP